MNREDITRMAKEAGMYRILDEHANEFGSGMFDINLCDQYPELEQFAKLITVHLLPSMTWQEGYEAGVLEEREACAKDIRARGME